MASKCKLCGEQIAETGNFAYKILPAKKIPKKAQKLMKAESTTNDFNSLWVTGTTKFQKFLLKRARPANVMILTCGKCGGETRIKMQKPSHKKNSVDKLEKDGNVVFTSPSLSGETNTSSNYVKERKRNRKKFKDKSAGLTIPGFSSSIKKQSTDCSPRSSNSAYKKPVTKAQRQRELENLNKMLFNSKKAKRSGSTLQDFLSSI